MKPAIRNLLVYNSQRHLKNRMAWATMNGNQILVKINLVFQKNHYGMTFCLLGWYGNKGFACQLFKWLFQFGVWWSIIGLQWWEKNCTQYRKSKRKYQCLCYECFAIVFLQLMYWRIYFSGINRHTGHYLVLFGAKGFYYNRITFC